MTVKIHAGSALLGAAVLALVVLVLGAFQQPRTDAIIKRWPPHPKHIVNIYDDDGVVVPVGGTSVLYEIPADMYLIVTGAWTEFPSPSVYVSEELDGVLTRKGRPWNINGPVIPGGAENLEMTPARAGGPIGWVFRPSSRVVFDNPGNSADTQAHSIVGYLTPR